MKKGGIMRKPGGRPKAEDIWEHVTVLPGGKQVECKYCKFKFAASANRIKSHIHRIEGKGVRICPKSEKIMRDLKEKEDLSDSQDGKPINEQLLAGLLTVDKSRDYNKPHKTMLDCYMSPKTMWEGIKAIRQVHTYNEATHHERIKVGPFYVSNVLNECDLQLIRYIFEHSSDRCKVFSSSRSFLDQSDFTTLRPQTHLDSWVIDIFADILTDIEKNKKNKPFNWYLPETFSRAAINSSSFVNFVEKQKVRENYMSGDLKYCEKIFIPVHVEKNSCGHYYLYSIHMKNREVEVWDSLCPSFLDETEHDEKTQKLLCAMEELFGKVIMFTKFDTRMATNILLQPNGYDCGIFVINYMQQSDNYVRQNRLFQFDSDKERLDLALKLIKNDLNREKEDLYKAARSYAKVQSEEALDLRSIKRKRLDTCKTIFGDVEGRRADMELDDSGNRDEKRNNVGSKTECIKGYELMTTDLVGDEFQSHTQQIWGWIMKNEVSSIGIWGMGGAGKTALAIHVNNKLLQEAYDDFDHIIWVTMSQCGNSVYELQKAIARSIKLDVSDECDIRRISGKLLQAFKHINKCVLILDDAWDPISLEDVGFPVSNYGIKLILTTRSWEVCQNMNCKKNVVKITPLNEINGWLLFTSTLGIFQVGDDFEERNVTNQCEGLPLAIVTIANSMKGKEDIREWNHLLECLQNLDNGEYDVTKQVFLVLKASYDCLSSKLQEFFLYHALRVKEYENDAECLIRLFFNEKGTDETKSLEMQYNEGYAMLKKLENASLLMENGRGSWKIHTLVRVMAINIVRKTEEIMWKTGMNLMELPKNEEWKENLQKAFLSGSNLQKILDGTSPRCSKLSTLLLDQNNDLKWIPDDFFSNMPALQILDLSSTGIERLPNSISNLECLIALLLSGCEKLRYVPSLAKLQQLIELDLSDTAITEAPCGLELLVNLRCLNLKGVEELKMSSSAISKMTNLRSLLMNEISNSMVRGRDFQGLRKLEVISVNFCDLEELNVCVKGILGEDCKLKKYSLSSTSGSMLSCSPLDSERKVILNGVDLGNRNAILPKDINALMVIGCDHWTRTTCLCHALSLHTNNSICFLRMKILEINKSKKLEYLCCMSADCSFCHCLQLVGTLSLFKLTDLKQIVAPCITLPWGSQFVYFTHLNIYECSSMKIVMTPELLAQLLNLETISVRWCESMEEIVGENYCIGNTSNPTIITLPTLTSVRLIGLPKLNSVFRGTMFCPSLKFFEASSCEKLNPPDIEIGKGRKLHLEIEPGRYFWQDDPIEEEEEEEEDDYLV